MGEDVKTIGLVIFCGVAAMLSAGLVVSDIASGVWRYVLVAVAVLAAFAEGVLVLQMINRKKRR